MWEWIHIFLISALAGSEWLASHPGRLTPGEKAPSAHWIGGWVDPRAGLDDVEKRKFLNLPGLELRPLGSPARNQLLYRLRYPGSFPPTTRSSNWSIPFWISGQNFVRFSHPLPALSVLFPNLSCWFYHSNNIWRGVHIMWIPIMQFSPVSFSLNIFSTALIFRTPSVCFLHLFWETISPTITKKTFSFFSCMWGFSIILKAGELSSDDGVRSDPEHDGGTIFRQESLNYCIKQEEHLVYYYCTQATYVEMRCVQC
jgi:hypothetical protein